MDQSIDTLFSESEKKILNNFKRRFGNNYDFESRMYCSEDLKDKGLACSQGDWYWSSEPSGKESAFLKIDWFKHDNIKEVILYSKGFEKHGGGGSSPTKTYGSNPDICKGILYLVNAEPDYGNDPFDIPFENTESWRLKISPIREAIIRKYSLGYSHFYTTQDYGLSFLEELRGSYLSKTIESVKDINMLIKAKKEYNHAIRQRWVSGFREWKDRLESK